MAQKDRRLYGKFTLDMPNNQKIAILSDAAFRCLVEATLWSREQLSDGLLARRYAVARWGLDVLQELCHNDDENPSLIEVEKGWIIHDYAYHQDTRAEVEARSERNKAAGQKGGLAKARRPAKRGAKRPASATLSENLAETETETETHEEPPSGGSSRAKQPQRLQPSFTEQLRGEPDTPPPTPPDDRQHRPVASTAAATIVREVIPANSYPPAVLTELRLRVSLMLNEDAPEHLVREALRLWHERDGGPGLLPYMLADAAKSLRPTPRAGPNVTAPGEAKVLGWAELGNPNPDTRKAIGQ